MKSSRLPFPYLFSISSPSFIFQMEDNPHPGALSQADSDTPRHAAVSKSPVAVVSTSENARRKRKIVNLEGCENLESVKRYAERGIPFRRGYLLHGVPGSGKTSLIHSLAGELGLDIYVVSLSSKGMSDNTLTTLMGHVPSRYGSPSSTIWMPFTRSVSHDASSTGAPTASNTNSTTTETSDGSTLSLSGLLNSLDGVAAAEGQKLPLPKRKARSHTIPVLDETEISELAKRFADAIPENELSVAALQGYLLKNKVRPANVLMKLHSGTIIEERETREKLKKEKAEREAKEKKETEEKECKEVSCLVLSR
ncbi:hypothetical protein EV424DRAFT_1642094 [Suillus variegatus]|nr:hypothetical protein EV424DRAFT_1642094 [Suillus variegatus]